MGIQREYEGAEKNPLLRDPTYSGYITSLILEWENQFEGINVILHLSQYNGISEHRKNDVKISEDKKQIDIYYELGVLYQKRKVKSSDNVSEVLASIRRLFERALKELQE